MARPNPLHFDFTAIGTTWRIATDTPLSPAMRATIEQEIETFDHEFSRFRSDSLVTQLALHGGSATFHRGVPELFELYDQLYAATAGRVTPLIGDTLSDLGYDATYSLRAKSPRQAKKYHDTLRHTGQTVTLTEPTIVDIGAAGKGYLIDRLSSVVARDHASFTVDGSGDLYTGGESQIIGLEHPDDPTLVIGQVELANAALCASATNRRRWGDGLHHVIDPVTSQPVQGVIATWVIADSAMLADGLATALFFTDPDRLAKDFDFRYVMMHTDGSLRYSPDRRITFYE